MKILNSTSGTISLSESDFLKGLGITLIFIHNYLHWSGGTGIENEMLFSENHFLVFKNNYLNSLSDFFIYGFSFFGHFGVQLFIFISVYGLTVKYKDVKLTLPNYVVSVLPRLVNIVLLFLLGILLTKIILLIYTDFKHSVQYFAYVIAITVTTYKSFFKNLIYEYMGPYWYFSIAIQIYLLHPFFMSMFQSKNRGRAKLYVIFIITSYCLIVPLYFCLKPTNISLFSNIIGHLPTLFLGIYLGVNSVKVNQYLFLALLPILVLSQVYEWLFPFSFLMACLSLLSFGNFLFNSLPAVVVKIFRKIGEISMIVFVLNGPLRMVSYFNAEPNLTDPAKLLQFTIVLFILSFLIYWLYTPLAKKITNNTRNMAVSLFKTHQN
jgi:peptidoglycan/LPS O-acetylase OafA/YrhL